VQIGTFENIRADLKASKGKELNKIYNALPGLLDKYDHDTWIKDLLDWIKRTFADTRKRCVLIIDDLLENYSQLNDQDKASFRKDLLAISEIHMTVYERLQALFDAL